MTDQITEKQHFVPKFYLKRFANDKKMLSVLDTKTSTMLPQKPYPGVCYASFFYAAKTGVPDSISQDIESWLQQIESYVASKMETAIGHINSLQPVSDDERYAISVLLSMLWLRSPTMRKQLNHMEEDIVQKIMSLDAEQRVDKYIEDSDAIWSEKERLDAIDMLENRRYILEQGNVQHLRFMVDTLGFGSSGFANMFHGKKWRVYLARGERRFITSDSPVVEWWLPPQGFYGRDFMSRNHYFSLTPDIFIELTHPIGGDKIKRRTLFKGDDHIVQAYNHLIAAHAHEYAYSGNGVILQDMVTGRSRPGPAERLYVERFEAPWRDKKMGN